MLKYSMEDFKKLKEETMPLDKIDLGDTMMWFVFDGKKPIGYAGLRLSARWKDCCYLNCAGVLPEYQGKGIQKKLIRARVAKARKLGMEWVFSDTYRNPASENSLIACGFKLYLPEDEYATQHSIYWRKKLK